MKFRKSKYTENGDIDLEIKHEKYGWIPFTASADDDDDDGREIYKKALKAGGIAAYVAPAPMPEVVAVDTDIEAAIKLLAEGHPKEKEILKKLKGGKR